jgi:hypothetical protein
MKRVLENVLPVGAPGAGPEAFRYASCFASLRLYLDKYDGRELPYCNKVMGNCMDCGECQGPMPVRMHNVTYGLYLTVSGIGLGTVWSPDLHPGTLLSSIPCGDDDYIAWSMRYAGYRYRTVARDERTDNREEMRLAVTRAIDRGVPVLAEGVAGTEWSLVTGYDRDGETLIGWYENWYGRDWEPPAYSPDGYLDSRLFFKSNWYSTAKRLVIVEGQGQRDMTLRELCRNLAAVLQKEQSLGCLVGFAAYDALLGVLADDARLAALDKESLVALYRYVHGFIGRLAEGRSYVGNTLQGCLKNEPVPDAVLVRFRSIGSTFYVTHNLCWEAWSALGANHLCEPKYAEGFRDPRVRARVAGLVQRIADNDRRTLQHLQACEGLL